MKKRNIKFHLTAKKLIVILFVFIVSTASASTIHIPDDYSTIQAGIDAASYGDVVLVDVGTYVENINFNGKNITVSINYSPSLNKGKLRQAIIDGNGDGSVVTFENGENSNAVLDGFTIQNGHALINGGGIYCDGASPTLKNLTIKDNSVQYYDGGGIYCGNGSHPEINNSEITNNSAYNGGGIACRDGSSPTLNSLEIKHNTASYNGGGLYCYNSSPQVENSIFLNNTSQTGGAISCRLSANPDLTNLTLTTNTADYGGGLSCYNSSSPSLNYVSITNNTAQARGGGIYCYDSSPVFNANNSCNLHSNLVTSQRGAGLEIFSEECTDISVIVDTFTVMSPSDRYASPLAIYTFDIDHSMEDDLINADLYVAEDGDNSNSGTSAAEPLQTIKHALDIIYSDAANINTIHVAAGTYSPSNTGEEFPLRWSNYVNLSGDEAGTTILDAEGTAGVLEFRDVDEALIQDLTLKGGSAKYGGGVYCNYASPELKHLAIVENTVLYDGAGVYCYHSQPQLTNLTISNNEGDGVYCLLESSLTILNTIVTDNTGYGIYDQTGDDTTVEYCDVWNNETNYDGCSAGTGTISADPLFIDMNAGDYHLATTSPCIDTGDPTSPQDPDGTNADMGAFYFNQLSVTAEFSAQPTYGSIPLNVNFTDLSFSLDSLVSWEWDFQNDGTVDSYEQNPTYVYSDSGHYTIALKVTNTNNYSDTEVKEDYIWTVCGNDVDGYAFLDGENDNSGIKVKFQRTSPSSFCDSAFTNSDGYYSLNLPEGIYDLEFSKNNYYSLPLDTISLYTNTTIQNITLYTYVLIPDYFTTIQEGINYCQQSDTVLVDVGTYLENIDFNGKNITLGSKFLTTQDTSYITQTIIDGNANDHVVKFNSGEDSTAILNGFTITNGNAGDGGGIYCSNSSPSLLNLIITNNSATGFANDGGGVFCRNNSNPSLENVTISNNSADDGGGGFYCSNSTPSLKKVTISGNIAYRGGGISCRNSNPSLTAVTVSNNLAEEWGGGIFCYNSSPSLENVTISNNSAEPWGGGGGIYCYSSNPSLTDVTISNNFAKEWGGGIYCSSSSPSLTAVTISNNSADDGGGGIYCKEGSSPILKNIIVSNNNGDYGIFVDSGDPIIEYCDFYNNENENFYGCDPEMGINVTTNTNGDSCDIFYNIQMNPLFVDPANGDYHLSWANFPTPDYTMSPCIDAGDPSSPLDPDGTIADIGAFYFNQNQAVGEEHEYALANSFISYPNPITSQKNEISISFLLKKTSKVNLKIYNIKGQLVSEILDDYIESGKHTVSSSVNSLSPGIYFIKMDVNAKKRAVKKMIRID